MNLWYHEKRQINIMRCATSRLALLCHLLAALTLLACRLPASIAQTLAQETPTLTRTPFATSTPSIATPLPDVTSYPGLETAYPAPGTAYPGPTPENPYPGLFGLAPSPGAEQATPYPGPSEASPTFQTGSSPPTLPPTRTNTPVAATGPPGYPLPGSSGYPPPLAGDLPYPGAQPLSPYPGLATPAVPAAAQSPMPTVTLPPSAPLPATTEPPVITEAPPVAPASTLFLTPTPTLTSTPTRTPTPLPPPPWVSARLYATNPSTVRLVSGKVQLVEFFAFWSGPSQAMAPIIQSLETEYDDRMLFTYLDIDDPTTSTFQDQLDFRVEPHFFLLDPQGRILHQWVGYVTPDQFRQAFQAALNP